MKSRKQRRSIRKTRRTRKQRGGQPSLIRQIAAVWRRRGYGSVKVHSGNYYLSCTEEDDRDTHIHMIESAGRYLYKRDGEHDYADGSGFGFEYGGTYCVEYGADTDWDADQWAGFLKERLCYQTEKGYCEGDVYGANSENGDNSSNYDSNSNYVNSSENEGFHRSSRKSRHRRGVIYNGSNSSNNGSNSNMDEEEYYNRWH